MCQDLERMNPELTTFLRREQRAFLRRDRRAWAQHLGLIRGFLGEGFRGGQKKGPVLVLGAGSGLEVPWAQAPEGATGWDADPWSRARTLLRHRRWVPWVFEDVTGAFEGLQALLVRALGHPWSGLRRDPEAALFRIAGLLPTLRPEPLLLRAWIKRNQPDTILAANFMGQIDIVAHRLVEAAFAPWSPWEEDPEQRDPLEEALDDWVARTIRAFLAELRISGADLWLVHDRGIIHGSGRIELGLPAEPWTAQLANALDLELSDPLCGVDLRQEVPVERLERWLWPVGPGQLHVMEAVFSPGSRGCHPEP